MMFVFLLILEAERRAEEQRQAQLRRMREQEARWRQIAPPILGEITVPGTGSGFVVDPVSLFSFLFSSLSFFLFFSFFSFFSFSLLFNIWMNYKGIINSYVRIQSLQITGEKKPSGWQPKK
jgi:hypothetical protein